MSLRAIIPRQTLRSSTLLTTRTFTITARQLKDGEPISQNPPSARDAGKKQHVSADAQSSASTQEHKTGDDHPAKQPDPQKPSSRSTGFNEVKGGVTGGKEGLGNRSDKKPLDATATEARREYARYAAGGTTASGIENGVEPMAGNNVAVSEEGADDPSTADNPFDVGVLKPVHPLSNVPRDDLDCVLY